LAAEIESNFGDKVELVVGKGGCFEVVVDGELVFSKKDAGRFPENSEVISALRDLSNTN